MMTFPIYGTIKNVPNQKPDMERVKSMQHPMEIESHNNSSHCPFTIEIIYRTHELSQGHFAWYSHILHTQIATLSLTSH